MKLTPRGDEVKAVVAILESDEYDSADKMAKALIKTVADFLDYRDWYALGHRFEGDSAVVGWGPYASESEAVKVAEKVSLGGIWTVKHLSSPGVLLGNVEGAPPGTKGFCQKCGHAPFMHLIDGSSRGACPLPNCGCDRFKK